MKTEAELQVMAKELAKGIKTEADLNQLSMFLQKMTVEAALNAELDEHLGYAKSAVSEQVNSRNGHSRKMLRTEEGQFELKTLRDRDGSFEPQLVKKRQTRFTSVDDKILYLYAKGMSTCEINGRQKIGQHVCDTSGDTFEKQNSSEGASRYQHSPAGL